LDWLMRDSLIFGTLFVVLTAVLVAVVIVITMVLVGITNSIGFPVDQARIEQLRHDAANVDPQQAEDVIGQVTQTNQEIISMQAQNDIPIWNLSIPDGWDDIEPIPVPQSE
jgi:hypothetical protein